MPAVNPTPQAPTDPLELLPGDTVLLVPMLLPRQMRAPDGTWGFLVRAVQLLPTPPAPEVDEDDPSAPDPDDGDVVDLLAGVWLSEPPPADLHDGDLVLRITTPADNNPERVDVELQIAQHGTWQIRHRWSSLNERWPHVVATSVDWLMRTTTVNSSTCSFRHQMATRTRVPMNDTLRSNSGPAYPPLDALAELLDAGLLRIGTKLFCGPHRATVAAGGVLADDDPAPTPHLGMSTVSSRASQLLGCPANGWHVWYTRDGHLLNEVRVHHASRRP